MAKWWCTDLQGRVVDRCLQLFGGYGYMLEYPIARAFADARVTRIYGGANEIMKEIVGRCMGLLDASLRELHEVVERARVGERVDARRLAAAARPSGCA